MDSTILATARAHEAFQLVIRSGARRRISKNFATESDALMLIWRGLAISFACAMAVLMKLPARTMHSLAGGGNRVKPVGDAYSDKGAHEFKSSKYPDYINPRRRKLTEDAG